MQIAFGRVRRKSRISAEDAEDADFGSLLSNGWATGVRFNSLQTGKWIANLDITFELSNSEMRPPVLTPNMKRPWLWISNVPVKAAETRRISLLSRVLVLFITFVVPL